MTNVERVLALIRSSPGGLTDREIRERTGISPHQQVNQIGNRLAREGLTRREPDARGVLVNRPAVDDERDPSVPAVPRTKERDDGTPSLLEMDLANALLVIPCSGGKRAGGAEGLNGSSILEFLPEELSDELRTVRRRNAVRCQVDESLWMPAVERYCGTLYGSAGATFGRLRGSVAGVAIISGGYGVVLADEQIGWYEQRFDPAMWPDDLVARSLSGYAKAIGAGTVVGMFGATTHYAKAFRRAKWPAGVQDAWLVVPEPAGGGALVKVPRAIGEALAVIGSRGTLSAGWRSSDGLPARVMRIGDRSLR